MTSAAWAKLYKRELFIKREVWYPVGRLFEDMHVFLPLNWNAERIVFTPETTYFYYQQPKSICHTLIRENFTDKLYVKNFEHDFLEKHVPELLDAHWRVMLNELFFLYMRDPWHTYPDVVPELTAFSKQLIKNRPKWGEMRRLCTGKELVKYFLVLLGNDFLTRGIVKLWNKHKKKDANEEHGLPVY